MREMTFTAIDKDGNEVLCEILFTFTSDHTGKDYMVYTDHREDEEGNTMVYASIYDPGDEESELIPVESDEEWYYINQVLQEIQREYLQLM